MENYEEQGTDFSKNRRLQGQADGKKQLYEDGEETHAPDSGQLFPCESMGSGSVPDAGGKTAD